MGKGWEGESDKKKRVEREKEGQKAGTRERDKRNRDKERMVDRKKNDIWTEIKTTKTYFPYVTFSL